MSYYRAQRTKRLAISIGLVAGFVIAMFPF